MSRSQKTSPTHSGVNRLRSTLAPLSPYRREHPLERPQLVYNPVRPGFDRILRMAHLRGRTDHEDPGVRVGLAKRTHELKSVPVGQPAVEERYVYAFEHHARLGQRTGLGDHLKIRLPLQQGNEGLPEVGAVVDHQDTQHRFLLESSHTPIRGSPKQAGDRPTPHFSERLRALFQTSGATEIGGEGR